MRAHRELTVWTQSLAKAAHAAEGLRARVTSYAVDDPAIPPAAMYLVTCLRDARDERWGATPTRVSATVRSVLAELEEIARPRRLLEELDVREAWETVCDAIDDMSAIAASLPCEVPAAKPSATSATATRAQSRLRTGAVSARAR